MSQEKRDQAFAGVAIIIVDSGFSRETMERAQNLLGYYDLNSGIAVEGQPMLDGQSRDVVLQMAEDPLNHGSIILDKLLAIDPSLPFVLVRAFDGDSSLIRTTFTGGHIARAGWTEGYLWAQNLCRQKGYRSVANFSFGGFHHAMDGSGWEAHQLSSVVGPGKTGHLVVAATGPGDGRALHASFVPDQGEVTVHAYQPGTSTYNLWVNRLVEGSVAPSQFVLTVRRGEQVVYSFNGADLPANLWNGRQQLTFTIEGEGELALSVNDAVKNKSCAARFDIFISRENGAFFHDFVDSELVSEPAALPLVVAVGLEIGSYGQCFIGQLKRPEILLPGPGPISFRAPEVAYRLVEMLRSEPDLDLSAARERLFAGGKL